MASSACRAGTVWSSLLALLLAAPACQSSSPSSPDGGAASATIVFADGGALAAHQAVITALLRDTFDRAGRRIPVGSVRIDVTADPGRSIPGWGMGGYAISPTEVDIVFDPAYPGLAGVLADRLPPLTAHEIHHTVRWRSQAPGRSLLETMVFEGLADHFAIELMGSPVPPWCTAFPPSENASYLDRARPELDNPRFDYQGWFFGVNTDLPPWTGYTLGYRLVADYLAAHPGNTAASLVGAPASAFRPPEAAR
jgi:hypothetical protein